jgi:hypothetical protein
MNIRIPSFALVPALFLLAAPLATAAIINFESLTPGLQTGGTFPVEAGFYIFMEISNFGDDADIVNIGGVHGNVLEDGRPSDPFGSVITISLVGGGLFNLNSVDIANFGTVVQGFTPCRLGPRIEFTDGGRDCADFSPATGFTTVSPRGFQGISRLTVDVVSSDGTLSPPQIFAVDNINVSPVDAAPEPSTVLLGAAGIFLIAFRRKFLTRCNAIPSTTGHPHCTSAP